MRRFFVSSLPTQHHPHCILTPSETHHLFRVVKIAIGEAIVLFDGKGSACIAHLVNTQHQQAVVEWKETIEEESRLHEVWLYVSVLKEQAWSTSLRMATELGVHHIVPIVSNNTIVRKEKRERWQSIILASAKQSGRNKLPMLHTMISFSDIASCCISARYILSPSPSNIPSLLPIASDTALCIGPEGGFTQEEITKATQHGWVATGLGEKVLRADTAVVAALSLFLFS